VPVEVIERRILLIRGHKVMLDRDLAALYQFKPIALRQAVKRNRNRTAAFTTQADHWIQVALIGGRLTPQILVEKFQCALPG
jgi:hypothetical protein